MVTGRVGQSCAAIGCGNRISAETTMANGPARMVVLPFVVLSLKSSVSRSP
jgi:hypothetical protein